MAGVGLIGSGIGLANTILGADRVTLGSMVLTGIEVPEVMRWGGAQAISVQVAPGGDVSTSRLGVRYAPIRWNGIFSGPAALLRSRMPYTMMAGGKPVTLSWNDRSYTVLVASYQADDKYQNWIPYSIQCVVIKDNALTGGASAPGVLGLVTSAISSATGLTPTQLGTLAGQIQQAAAIVGQATNIAGAVFPPKAARTTQAQGALSTAQATAVAQQQSNAAAIAKANTAAGSAFVAPPGSATGGLAAFNELALVMAAEAALPAILGYLGQAAANIKASGA
jgi:hypothetical protein